MIANLYKDQIFYIPTLLDFRGRLDSKVAYLNYKAGDLARSLFQFYLPNDNININKFKNSKNPYKTPISYVKQSAGNVYNLSKKIIKIKIEWCDKFIEDMKKEFDNYYPISKISNISSKEVEVLSRDKEGDSGLSYTTLVGLNKSELDFDFYFLNQYLENADEPFQFIAAYYSIKDIFIKKQYNINIPILFDASCSGIQHLASIACDIKVAKLVNVVNTEHAKSDFYQIAANYVVNSINNMELKN